MAYRANEPPDDVDHEEIAVAALGRHARRVRQRILLPAIFGGLALAVGGYLVARELQFALMNAQWPWLSGVVGGLPPFAACVQIGRKMGDAIVRKRAPTWAADAVRTYELPEGSLDEFLEVL